MQFQLFIVITKKYFEREAQDNTETTLLKTSIGSLKFE